MNKNEQELKDTTAEAGSEIVEETAAETEKARETADNVAEDAGAEGADSEEDAEEQDAENAPKKKTFLQMLDEYVNADEEIPLRFSLQAVFGGDSLLGIVVRNKLLLCVIVLFSCINISFRYMMDDARVENDQLNRQLIDRRYKALSLESRLKEMTLSTHIEGLLRDTTIQVPTEQAYSLSVPEKKR